jgi:hypothetical protein
MVRGEPSDAFGQLGAQGFLACFGVAAFPLPQRLAMPRSTNQPSIAPVP